MRLNYFIFNIEDYDEKLLTRKLVISYKEEKLTIRNYLIKAQSNPLNPISIESILNSE